MGGFSISAAAWRLAAACSACAALALSMAGGAHAAPKVRILAPAAGHVAGTVRFATAASREVRAVAFSVDGTRRFVDRRRPFRYRKGLDTRRLRTGKHVLEVRALTRAGRAASARRVVWVANQRVLVSRRDRRRPVVSIAAPVAGRTVSGRLGGSDCVAEAADDRGVRRVEFAVDGRIVNVEREAPYTCDWNTATVANGSHTLAARAFDAAGNSSTTSAPVTVSNQAQATPQPAPGQAGRSPVFRSDFEGSGIWGWEQAQRVAADRIAAVASPVAEGSRAARFEVRSGDLLWATNRAELAWGVEKAGEGMERIYSWQTYFDPGYPSVSKWQVTTQWKNEGDGSPPLKVEVVGDRLSLSGGLQVNWASLFSTPLVRGRWLRFAVRVKWSSDPGVGWVSMWYQGQQVVDRYRMATLFPGQRNYFKMGLYRDNSIAQTGVVYHDDVTITAP